MKLLRHALATTVLLGGLASTALAQPNNTQVVTITVDAVNNITLTNATKAIEVLTIGSATYSAGTYSVTTNQPGKITGQLTNGGDFTDLDFSVALGAPSGGNTEGVQPLVTANATDLVTSIEPVSQSGLSITYTVATTVTTATGARAARTVTYTMVP